MRTPAIDAADRRIRAPGTGEPARAIGGSDGRVIGTSAAPRGTSSIADDPPRGKTPHERNGAPAHGHRPPDRVPPRRPRGTPWREHRAGTPSHTAARSRAARCHGHHDTGAGVLPTVPGAAGGVVPWNLMNILATDHIPSADPPMPRAPVRPDRGGSPPELRRRGTRPRRRPATPAPSRRACGGRHASRRPPAFHRAATNENPVVRRLPWRPSLPVGSDRRPLPQHPGTAFETGVRPREGKCSPPRAGPPLADPPDRRAVPVRQRPLAVGKPAFSSCG